MCEECWFLHHYKWSDKVGCNIEYDWRTLRGTTDLPCPYHCDKSYDQCEFYQKDWDKLTVTLTLKDIEDAIYKGIEDREYSLPRTKIATELYKYYIRKKSE